MTTVCANHSDQAAVAFCRSCGKPLCRECVRDVRGAIFCEECLAARLGVTSAASLGAVPPLPPDVIAQQRGLPSPTMAAVLGTIPGVGAFYNAQYQKGIVHVLMFAALVSLADQVDFVGVFIPFFFFYMVWDAYKTAKSRVTGEPVPDPLGINNLFGLEDIRKPEGTFLDGRLPMGPLVLIGLGVLFLLGQYSRHFLHTYWPVVLIVIGVVKAVRVLERGRQEV